MSASSLQTATIGSYKHCNQSSKMPRGNNWDCDENEHLAKAWIATSEDPIVVVDQTRKVFKETVYKKFFKLAPSDKDKNSRYGSRTMTSVTRRFSDISADVQKFRSCLHKINACDPTGVNEDSIVSIAVAHHLGESNGLDYTKKDFDVTKWMNFNAWKVLRYHPKWSNDRDNNSIVSDHLSVTDSTVNANDAPPSIADTSEGENSEKAIGNELTIRYPVGVKAAKASKQEEIRTKVVCKLADAAKRKSDCLEERNAIAIFSRPEAQGLPETEEFFADLRKIYLERTKKRVRLEILGEAVRTNSNTTTPINPTSAATTAPSTATRPERSPLTSNQPTASGNASDE